MTEEIPYFIQMRGCAHCGISQALKERTGKEYGFHHELVAGCLLHACFDHGYGIYRPFLDPAEIVRFAQRENNPVVSANARAYILRVKERFDRHFKHIGVSLDDLLQQLK